MEKTVISAIKHIAFIMDGNGRWAKAKGMSREYGHREGAKTFRKITRYCGDIGIDCVTVYAFSTENWKRPQNEVDALIKIFKKFISEAKRTYKENKMHVIFLGNKDAFDEKMRASMIEVEEMSKEYERKLCVALNYGGRAEIVDAVNAIAASGKVKITEDDITENIYSGCCPPPDMIIRTGGEKRLSNFLLWQSSYAELFFTDTLWPDFTTDELDGMIEEFGKRKRRYGGV
ncbi:MAG: di-trans,poly-cis-decaprenylcistransferase [Clostridia bacterium]|nr:di-trans,poly-cis-decaprenylcistransferase [Clostridia bacterium]